MGESPENNRTQPADRAITGEVSGATRCWCQRGKPWICINYLSVCGFKMISSAKARRPTFYTCRRSPFRSCRWRLLDMAKMKVWVPNVLLRTCWDHLFKVCIAGSSDVWRTDTVKSTNERIKAGVNVFITHCRGWEIHHYSFYLFPHLHKIKQSNVY